MTGDLPAERLAELRGEIERLSHQVVALLNQRARLVEELMVEKRRAGQPLRDPARERDLVQRLAAASDGPLGAEAIERLFRVLFDDGLSRAARE